VAAPKKRCKSGKHTLDASNTGEKGRCLDCKRDYQRVLMRKKRLAEQLGGDMSPQALRRAVNEAGQ
jgi:hypothetical protein